MPHLLSELPTLVRLGVALADAPERHVGRMVSEWVFARPHVGHVVEREFLGALEADGVGWGA